MLIIMMISAVVAFGMVVCAAAGLGVRSYGVLVALGCAAVAATVASLCLTAPEPLTMTQTLAASLGIPALVAAATLLAPTAEYLAKRSGKSSTVRVGHRNALVRG